MIKQHELEAFQKKEYIELMCSVVTALCLRLGNLYFLEKQIKNVANDLFQSKSLMINQLLQEIADYCNVRRSIITLFKILTLQKISKIICQIIMSKYLSKMIFQQLYINIDEHNLIKMRSQDFQQNCKFINH